MKFTERLFAIAVLLALFAIAFGANWMAFEQRRANTGFFVPAPSMDPTPYHRVDPPAAKEF